jgi:hypothetical protein
MGLFTVDFAGGLLVMDIVERVFLNLLVAPFEFQTTSAHRAIYVEETGGFSGALAVDETIGVLLATKNQLYNTLPGLIKIQIPNPLCPDFMQKT